MNKDEKQKTEENKDNIVNAGLAGASAEIIQRYGSANKQHFVSYIGLDNESGQALQKGLKSISKEKINSEYEYQNIKQQAGFSAEVKKTARDNAEKIINNDKTRTVRTDDLGRVNDPLYDHVEIDPNGHLISGSGSQMKFVGSNPKEALAKLNSSKFQKYFDNDIIIDVPSDFFDGIQNECDLSISSIKQQIAAMEEKGVNSDAIEQKKAQLEKYKRIKKNIRKSNVSNNEAIEARLNPVISTAKDIVKVSHRAGIEAFKQGAVISGAISLVRNFVSVVRDEKTPQEAGLAICVDVGTGSALSYTSAFAGSAIKGAMQNAKNGALRSLSKTNLPGTFVTLTVETTRIISKYCKGEIESVECLEKIGENSAGLLSSAMFSSAGISLASAAGASGLGIAAMGLAGGMVGYAILSSCYSCVMSNLKDARLSHDERLRIEKECSEMINEIRAYRKEIESMLEKYFSDKLETFHSAFEHMKKAINLDDIDGFINGANTITQAFGGKIQFSTFDEFDEFMVNSNTFKL